MSNNRLQLDGLESGQTYEIQMDHMTSSNVSVDVVADNDVDGVSVGFMENPQPDWSGYVETSDPYCAETVEGFHAQAARWHQPSPNTFTMSDEVEINSEIIFGEDGSVGFRDPSEGPDSREEFHAKAARW